MPLVQSVTYNDTETWDAAPVDCENPTTVKTGSTRKYGVEVETSNCPNYRELYGQTVFGAKYDCSVSGMEFVSPILVGDEGFEKIDAFFELADARSFDVNGDCGLHVHLDVSEENTVQLRHIAYAYSMTYAAWRGLVSEWRANDCHYCHAPSYGANEIRLCGKIKRWLRTTDRYSYLNFTSYDKFGSYECRLMDGSVNPTEIKNWIMAHIRFIDAVRNMTYDQIDAMFNGNARAQFSALRSIWDNADGDNISNYYNRRFHVHGPGLRNDDDDDDDDNGDWD